MMWRVSASRRGDSKKTMVRGSSARLVKVRVWSPVLRGGNPSKVNRSVGSPESRSAVVTADGPGRQVTGWPAWVAAWMSR